jgi:ADP-dependent NAD(P)H-hydrate dehydratase / NAD(P)H-hydrate epimerase
MKRVLSASEMRAVDRLTTEKAGIPSLLLMENAAAQVNRALEQEFAPLSKQRVVVLCGKGANGGDGLAIARQLWVQGIAGEVEALLFADPAGLKDDAAANWRMAQGVGLPLHAVTDSAGWRNVRSRVLRATLAVDALLGTGLEGPARGLIGDVIDDLSRNFGHVSFAAVDLPSGMPSDAGELFERRCPADITVTFTAPKLSQVLPSGPAQTGKLRIAPIGTPDSLIEGLPGPPLYLLESRDAKFLCAPRPVDSHKGGFGHLAAVGGSRAKPGAVIMADMAGARAGAGLTTVVTSQSATSAVVSAAPELMTIPVPESADGSMSASALDPSLLDAFSVLVVGPGLGTSHDNLQLCRSIISKAAQPVVADADALTALSRTSEWTRGSAILVLTPHPGEMARLLGTTAETVQADRTALARKLASERNAYVVLKGAATVIAAPDGRAFLNPTGTPGMATGGSGDILAGMIGGLLAQFPAADPALVLCGAVYLHGLAGELAASELGEQAMLATDILKFLPQAVRFVQQA